MDMIIGFVVSGIIVVAMKGTGIIQGSYYPITNQIHPLQDVIASFRIENTLFWQRSYAYLNRAEESWRVRINFDTLDF